MEERSVREIPVPLLLNQILHAQTYRIMQCMKDVDLSRGRQDVCLSFPRKGNCPSVYG